jgi:hypothetical protein
MVRAMQALYTHDTQPLQLNMPAAPQGPTASAASAAAAAAAACGTQPAAKRRRVEQQQQQQQQQQQGRGDADKVTLIVKTLTGSELHFIVKSHIQLGKLFDAYAGHESIDVERCRFIYSGRRLSSEDTPQELGMVDQDVIHCIMQLRGC